MKITFGSTVVFDFHKSSSFLVYENSPGKTRKSIFPTENVSVCVWVLQERFSNFSNNRFFKQRNCRPETDFTRRPQQRADAF